MTNRVHRTFGQVVKEGLAGLSAEQVEAGVKESRRTGAPALECLVRLGFVDESTLLMAVAGALEIEFRDLAHFSCPPEIVRLLHAKQATRYGVLPLARENGVVTLATSDPFAIQSLDELKLLLKADIRIALAATEDIQKAIKRHYGIGADAMETASDDQPQARARAAAGDLADEAAASDASVLKFVNLLLIEALKERATDIHIEPFENDLRVRYRVDGVLHDTAVPVSIKNFQAAIVSRIKVMANLDIAEHRLPQDGRIKISLAGEDFDLRVSILPTPFGESVNIRILNRSSVFMSLEDLGLDKPDLVKLAALVARPHGIILVTGPTGSGKTTTLYACINRINTPDRKILTIEDPIEYQLRGITQMQVHPGIGFTFSNALRSMLRHDPDVMLVGEIRDAETAEITIRTALTGHLVFSTLHTNDAAGAASRLFDMGIEPFLASSSILGFMAQRLVRRVCPRCREPVEIDAEALRELGVSEEDAAGGEFVVGRGCEYCRYTGYRGRIAICEILAVTEPIRRLMLERASANAIKQEACRLGMRTMRQDGWGKVKRGITTVEEVLRATAEDEILET